MQIFFPKEEDQEIRTTILPEVAKKFVDLGLEVLIEEGLGSSVFIDDSLYSEAGATVVDSRDSALNSADIVCRINKPKEEEITKLKSKGIHISFLDPFNETELVKKFASQEVSAISMELVPRITRAQKMDALSSQANLAGYSAVIAVSNTHLTLPTTPYE